GPGTVEHAIASGAMGRPTHTVTLRWYVAHSSAMMPATTTRSIDHSGPSPMGAGSGGAAVAAVSSMAASSRRECRSDASMLAWLTANSIEAPADPPSSAVMP